MGRGKGKGKNQSVIVKREAPGIGEEEKIPAYKSRGETDEIEEVLEVIEKIEKDHEENVNGNVSSNELKTRVTTLNKRKRKRTKEKIDPAKEESGINRAKLITDSVKSAGFRQNGSRRKNKPHRAAEAGVDCK